MSAIQPLRKPRLLEELQLQRELVLFNDDVNTFEHVIVSLMDVCNHDALQAEQCAFITHTNGKCGVQNGSYEDLLAPAEALLNRGLSVEIM
jgi:ATP-dependent Clp protease adaptor protein ClpS